MAYLFDSNTILEAKNRYYKFEVCPAFWNWLILERKRGNVLSIEAVKSELYDPDAKQWAASHHEFFQPNDLTRMHDVSAWVASQIRFTSATKNYFLSRADPRIIAYALVHGHTVVTQEVSAPKGSKVKIPDVCIGLSIPCVNTFEVLTELKARFVLETNDEQ